LFLNTIEQMQEFYKENRFKDLSLEVIKDLKYIYNVFVFEWVKKQCENIPGKSGIIDVDVVD
jgi:hypothetical protein